MTDLNYLKRKNPHERDQDTYLDEATHIYNINGETDYTSMTTFIHSLFEKFNPDQIIDNMMRSKNWSQNKYYGMTPEEIKSLWDANTLQATTSGTQMHYNIECFYNTEPEKQQQTNTSKEFKYFLNFHNDVVLQQGLEPYRTEWIVHARDISIAGSIDMVFKRHNKTDKETLDIYDWKRCREIKQTSGFNKWSIDKTIDHIPDTNYWHYSLQLNGYRYILEKYYNKRVENLYLVCLHPDNKNKNYMLIRVPDLQHEIHELFSKRKT